MAVTYGFYNALNHDRLYDAIQMSSIFDGIIRDGIFSTIGDCMVVSAPEDGLYVNVGSGRAWFNHTWTLNDTDYPIEAEEAEVVLDRIDAVVIEVNSAAEVRANSIKFIKGTPSSEPVKPTLIHNAEVNQYALAYVTIRAGQTTIFQQDIENVVGTDETPFITGLLQQVSIETLLTQWEAEFNTYFTNFQSTSTTEFNNWLAAKVAEYTAWYAQMQTDMDADFAEFDAWFQHMKDQLSEDAAGHLQAEIDALAEAAQKGSIVTVTTTDPTLFNRPVTISQTGFDPVTSTFNASGVAYFETVPMVGEVQIEATNGTLTAYGTLTIPYFGRYSTTLEFWEAILDISTNLQALYNRQITVSKDGATVGTTTFDATGHATFSVHSVGTYTVSATDSASVEHTADVVVSAETTYYVDLAGIPDGRTVLPTDDIGIWLACAEETVTYTTLTEVLADTELFARLCADSNACDYMARSTTWAKENGPAVPVMTSNTTPSGEVIATNSANAYKAFDGVYGDTAEFYLPRSVGSYIGYLFTENTKISKVKFVSNYTDGNTYKIQGFDGTDWNDIVTFTGNGPASMADYIYSTQYIDLPLNTPSYSGYRIYTNTVITTGGNSGMWEIQFYTDADITTNSTAMQIVGMFDYCAEALISNETWCEALAESDYYDYVFNGCVPAMTSATTPSGSVTCSSQDTSNGYYAWKMYDNTLTGAWAPSAYTSAGGWNQYTFANPVTISAFWFSAGTFSSSIARCGAKLQAMVNNSWVDMKTIDTVAPNTNIREVLSDKMTVTAIRVLCTGSNSNIYAYVFQVYGRTKAEEYIPLVPTMTSNTTPSGECFTNTSSQYSGREPWRAFDKTNDFWQNYGQNDVPNNLGYKFPTPQIVKKVAVASINASASGYSNSHALKTYNLYGSNDGTNWTLIKQNCQCTNTGSTTEEVVDNDTAYLYVALGDMVCWNPNDTNRLVCVNEVQFYSKPEGITIHSAANDTIYYLDGSTPVTVAVTDANGKAVIDTEDLDPGTHTLYSTVAKNPDNLSNPYTKTVKINGNTTEIYLMPILTLYWWGYENQSCLPYAVASGNNDGTYNTPPTLTRNTNYLGISQPWINSNGCRGCTVYDTPFDHASKINIIIESSWYDRTSVTNYTYESLYWAMSNTNNIANPDDPSYYGIMCRNLQTMPMTKFSIDFIHTDYLFILTMAWQHSCLAKQYALWYE